MAGFVVHLAVGEEYIRKHPKEIVNKNDFLNGIIYPDIALDKSGSHFTLNNDSSRVDLKKFISTIGINNDFNKGYFLHLYTDYMFHNYYFTNFNNKIYKDYDRSNKFLIDKYKVSIPKEIANKIYYSEDINFEAVEGLSFFGKVIDEISGYSMLEVSKRVINNENYSDFRFDFEYGVYNEILEAMKNGIKKIEIRLYNEKSSKIKLGNIIKFKEVDNETNYLLVKVNNLIVYNNVDDLIARYSTEMMTKVYDKSNLINDLFDIFGKEKVNSHKLIGIQFEVL